MLGPGTRQYSTSHVQRESEGDDADDLEVIQAKEEMDELLLQHTAEQALRKLLWANKSGKQELAWHLYSALIEPTPPVGLLRDTLDYLGTSNHARMASRVLQLFDRIPLDERRASSYRIAVTAYVELRMVGPAIQLLEEASERFDPTRTAIDAVLKRTIQDDQWDLSIRVFKMVLKHADRNMISVEQWNGHGNRFLQKWGPIFGKARKVLEPVQHLQNFLDHVDQFRHELKSSASSKRALALFVHGYVPGVMLEVLNMPDANEDYLYNFFTTLFRDLRARELPTWGLYDFLIPTLLEIPRYQEYTHEEKIFLDLYSTWRQEYLDGSCGPPSKEVMGKLIVQHGRHKSFVRVDAMVKDLRSLHPSKPFSKHTLRYLIQFYASGGMVDRVHEFFQIFQQHFASAVDLRLLTSLPYAYARRIDVPGAIREFKRITDEFKLVPDTACWNALLYAFSRADDLDGALECFDNCLGSGVKPNIRTFGPMLDLCATRGDVEAFEALFSRAKQFEVPVESDRRARAGYVQAFLNAGDAEGAEQIALGILHSWQAGAFGNAEITHVWNMLITYYGVAGEVSDSRRLYDQMVANKIPLDSWTYGALIRSMVEVKNTNAAYKILRVTMPAHNVRVHAFHYALIISGYLREKQIHKAKQVYQRMRAVKIVRTKTLRQQELLYTGTQDLLDLKEENVEDPRARMVKVEEQLRQSLLSDYGHEIAHDEPRYNRYIDSPELSNVPQGYFAMVIMLYTTRGALEIAKELIEKATASQYQGKNFPAPIALLVAIMETHYRAGEYDEVERCWELAREEANRLVKTFRQAMRLEPPTPEFDSITDPEIKTRFNEASIALNRRQILFRAARTYIRSLLAQDDPEMLQRAQRTIHTLLANGFLIDNITWNEFIQHLAQSNRVIDAFTACEMYLMPSFPGWSELNPMYIRKYRPGYSWMELRHYDVKRTSVLPKYKTMVILAAVRAQIRQDEYNGVGFKPELGGWVGEVLEKVAPNTIRAIDTMPKTRDGLQKKYLA